MVPGGLPWTLALSWPLTWLWVPSLGIALILLPLVFPTGHLVSPRWWPASRLAVVAILVFAIVGGLPARPESAGDIPGQPVGLRGPRPGGDRCLRSRLPCSIAASLSSMVLRFRHAEGEARQQMKWFALAVLGAGAAFAAYAVSAIAGVPAPATKGLEVLVILSLMTLPSQPGSPSCDTTSTPSTGS